MTNQGYKANRPTTKEVESKYKEDLQNSFERNQAHQKQANETRIAKGLPEYEYKYNYTPQKSDLSYEDIMKALGIKPIPFEQNLGEATEEDDI